MAYDGRHGFAHRVERVDFVQFVLGTRGADTLVVLAEVEHEAEQRALRLVADLLRLLLLRLRRLQTHHRCLADGYKHITDVWPIVIT